MRARFGATRSDADSRGFRRLAPRDIPDRYLFSADRKASEYRGVLEITPGRARLLTPSQSGRQVRWIVSIALALAYVYVASRLSSLSRLRVP